MEDSRIIELYFARSEQAIQETDAKYGGYCYSIAYNVLENRQDAEESVSDAYLEAWNAIPPKRPGVLGPFLGKLTRCAAIDRWRQRRAYKRGGGQVGLALEELLDCADPEGSAEERVLRREEIAALNRFLGTLPETERQVLLCRYWYLDSEEAIARATGFSRSKVASMLHRTRKKLAAYLRKEGIA